MPASHVFKKFDMAQFKFAVIHVAGSGVYWWLKRADFGNLDHKLNQNSSLLIMLNRARFMAGARKTGPGRYPVSVSKV
jgi:hypothetical protein